MPTLSIIFGEIFPIVYWHRISDYSSDVVASGAAARLACPLIWPWGDLISVPDVWLMDVSIRVAVLISKYWFMWWVKVCELFSASRDILSFITPTIFSFVSQGPSWFPILSQLNPFHTLSRYNTEMRFVTNLHTISPRLRKGLFVSHILTLVLYAVPLTPISVLLLPSWSRC